MESIIDDRLFENCRLCPRECGVNRLAGERGYCGGGVRAGVALTMIHKWEEPCVSGTDPGRGSGAIFFTGCTLGCVYCQNYAISRRSAAGVIAAPGNNVAAGDVAGMIAAPGNNVAAGDAAGMIAAPGNNVANGEQHEPENFSALRNYREAGPGELAAMMAELAAKGAYNINFVTPTHYMPVVAAAVRIARDSGTDLPVVYNTGGFELASNIKLLEGTVDVFLTDMKYLTDGTAMKYSGTDRYCANAREALREMVRITGGKPEFGVDGMLKRGVIVRHLVLPGRSYAASKIIKKLYAEFGDNIIYSLMNQYTPLPEGNPDLEKFPELLRTVGDGEYASAVDTLEEAGPAYAYIQEGGTISESFIPEW